MDWNYIFSLVPDDLNDEEKDQLFNTVAWYDLNTEEPSLEQSKILLKLSQELLKFKGEQVETLLHELDEIAIKQGEEEAKKILESDTDIRSSRSRKSSNIELENLEQRFNELKSKYKKQQRLNEKQEREINELKKLLRTLEHEKSQLEQDLQASKRYGSESSETSETVKDQHRELVETVHSKNKQLSDLLRDIEEVEKENLVLREKLANVRDELASATTEIQRQMEKLGAADLQLKESEDTIKKVTIDNELLLEEIQELTAQKTKVEEHLSEFTEEINKRIEDWQRVLEDKDEEIRSLRAKTSEISRHSSSPSNSFEGGQSYVSALQKLLAERDAQLMELQSRLEDAVKEMEASTELIEDMKKKVEEGDKKNAELNSMRRELKKQVKLAHERCQKLQEEVEYAEKLAENKSDDLEQVVGQLKESGHLDEAQMLEEIQEQRALIRVNEKQIMNLVKNINKLQDSNDQMAKENSFLREKSGIPEEESLPLPNYQSKHKQYKKEVLRLKGKVLQFEEENINLRSELKNLNRLYSGLQEELVEAREKETIILSMYGYRGTEFRVMELRKQRCLFFFREDCKGVLRRVPHILRCYEELKEEVKQIRSEVNSLKGGISSEDVLTEINDRAAWSSNFMIYNLKDSNAPNIYERKKFELDQVSGLIDELLTREQGAGASSNEHHIIEAIRVGKSSPDKPGVLKVVASSAISVKNILKN
ncbi:hypothetical protein HHI36_017520 [Cryptolaemus montrouzieri]|uniref:Uncharacterized protein n=1 Tax=Cryptolaemus montrouzieri TaxID=559131 RepID=A0ABD2NMS4_9CUCU